MPVMRVMLNISAEQMLRYYNGVVGAVVTRLQDGRTIQFPASALRHFVTRMGVHGEFLLHFDDNNKLVRLQPVGEMAKGIGI